MPHGHSQQITPAQFVAKWQRVDLPERAASQEHFIDLCRMLGQPTPAEHDATGAEYAFEKGVEVASGASKGAKGDRGFADVWWKNKFGWEYKRKGKYNTLDDAYRQLLQYREALESPPLLIVSDIARIEIHTNFTGTKKTVHTIALADLADPKSIDLLRRVFTDPLSFRPTITAEKITEDVAGRLGKVAEGLRSRGHDPHDTAHFLMKCMFCLFAEDVQLLPASLFKKLLEKFDRRPADLTQRLNDLFSAMRSGGAYGNDDIAHFNGGLFDTAPALPLDEGEIGLLNLAATQDWGSVEPAVFGTLFERSLDPAKRSQIGAHYTSREDILLVVEPVIMDPLRREWAQVQSTVNDLIDKRRAAKTPAAKKEVRFRDRRRVRFLPPPPLLRPRPRPRMRLRQLPLRRHPAPPRPRERSHHLRRTPRDRPRPLPQRPPDTAPRHRNQPLRRRTRPGRHLDRLPPVDARQRLPGPPQPHPRAPQHHREP